MKDRFQIKRSEYSLFLPLFATLTLLIFNTKVLKILKDTLVVTNQEVGAELLPFLKTWALIPSSLILITCLTKLQRRFSHAKVYGMITCLFLGFFGTYVYVLYPMGNSLYLTDLMARFEGVFPYIPEGVFHMIEFWPLTIFYVMCEMWHIMMVSLLFWSFANQVINYEQAKRFLPLLSVDLGGIVVGPLMAIVLFAAPRISYFGKEIWDKQLGMLTLIVIITGVIQMVIFLRFEKRIEVTEESSPCDPEKSKTPPLRELLNLAKSPLFAPLALIVFLFEFNDTLFDILWKDTLGIYLPDPQEFSSYLGKITFVVGIMATIIPLFVTRILLQRYSWIRVASITPFILLLMSTLFFGCFFFPNMATSFGVPFGMDALGVTVFFGATQSCLMQVAKITVFDNTKDLTFLAASPEERAPGKAFSDALATRVGKSSSCLMQQGLLVGTVTLHAASPYVACLIACSIPIWLISLRFVNRNYDELVPIQT